jgi:hypothetical protein
MSDDPFALPEEAPRRRWRLPFTWLGLLALAWIVYEVTHNPALGAVAVCLKFGWEDFRAARWLRRTDPDRRRGAACSWLYFGWGRWKTAAVAFLMSVGFAVVGHRIWAAPGGVAALWAFLGTFLTTLVGLGLSTLATLRAVELAWRGGVRLWLGRPAHRARRGDHWPPTPLCEGYPNRLGYLLGTTVAVLLVGVSIFLVVLTAAGGLPALGLVTAAFLLASPLLLLLLRDALQSRVGARTPAECWGWGGPPAETPGDPWADERF